MMLRRQRGEWHVGFVKFLVVVVIFYLVLAALLGGNVPVAPAQCMTRDQAAITGLTQAYHLTKCAFKNNTKQEFAGAVYQLGQTQCHTIDGPFPGQESSAVTAFDWSKGTPVGSYHSHPYDSSANFSGGDLNNYVLNQVDGYVVSTNTAFFGGDRKIRKFVPDGTVIDLETAREILRCQDVYTTPSGAWATIRHWWLTMECPFEETVWSYSVSGGKVSTLGSLPNKPLTCP